VGAEPSGGVYTPAIGISSFAISLVATTPPMNHWWIYLVGPFLGAAMATGLFMLQHPDDK
jgi:glycerol uptake facilitator-like aquaporin